jgi:hypothetical protein
VGVSVAAGGWDNVRDVVMELYENHLIQFTIKFKMLYIIGRI